MGINLLAGLAATGLALLQIAGWLGIGSTVFNRARGYAFPAPGAVVAGASVTGCLSAVLCWYGLVPAAIVMSAVLSLAGLALRREVVVAEARAIAGEGRAALAGHPKVRWLVGATAVVAWILAIAPPRDADVMRYHLAHVRQILRDGAWMPIADYHYALPFGWSINFLPFEALHLPEAAQVVNLLLFALAVVTVFGVVRPSGGKRMALWTSAMLVYQPGLLKLATTASADAFMFLIVAAIVGVLLSAERCPPAWTAGFGFLAWIGLQSRYQAAAIGLAVTAAWALGAWRRRQPLHLGSFVWGALAACLLSSPFYIVNAATFRNPFWPVFAGAFAPASGYADAIAVWYNGVLGGTRTFGTLVAGATHALRSPEVFPIPLICLVLPLLGWRRLSLGAGQLFVIVFGYLGVWAVMQPTLYARFFVYAAPPAVAAIGLLGGGVGSFLDRRGWIGRVAAWAPLVALMAVCVAYSQDAIVYFVGRDTARYHQATWFYDPEMWVNANTTPDGRVLVALNSAQTYYLDRPYRRADPCWSAVVDWPHTRTPGELRARLRAERFEYVLYEERDWSGCPGGREFMDVVEASRASGDLRQLQAFDVQLSTLRILRQFGTSRVVVFAVGEEPSTRLQ